MRRYVHCGATWLGMGKHEDNGWWGLLWIRVDPCCKEAEDVARGGWTRSDGDMEGSGRQFGAQ